MVITPPFIQIGPPLAPRRRHRTKRGVSSRRAAVLALLVSLWSAPASTLLPGRVLPTLLGQVSAQTIVESVTDRIHKVTVDGPWQVTVVAFGGSDGLLMVDSGFKSTVRELSDVLSDLGHGPPRILINTHSHKDHSGGNSMFGKSALVVAHAGFEAKLQVGSLVLEDYTPDAYPTVGVEDELLLFFNGERVRVKAFPGGHDGVDVIVWFQDSGVAYLGDLAYGMHFPSTDYFQGSLLEYPSVLSGVLDYLPPDTRIISGHGRDHSYAELVRFRDMLDETQTVIRERAGEGLSAAEIVDSGTLDPWDEFSDVGMVGPLGYVTTMLRDLAGGPSATKNILGALYDVSKHGDADAIRTEYERIKADEAAAYGLTDPGYADVVINYLWTLGGRLADDDRLDEALEVLGFLPQDYPRMQGLSLVYNRMGEIQLRQYAFDQARASFQRVLELSPDDENSRARMQLLDGVGR